MPRYYFSIENHISDVDREGSVLPDAHAARIAAVKFLAESLRDDPDLVWDSHQLQVKVEDERHQPILTVTVAASGPIADS
ncbi:DUF6894 family protein [Sphingomonas oligophenolica]|uniref:DUF6894 domain-containing protein n=1 Tax=Sphingomonas oligophenolica TaxID=301154 RepID=A0A502CLJ7_9SPHN|nr:hypothetical protein [Sphingomonas oligophenolica]TPG13622.1 hypothetical protein EAH84_05425 [Sphingomonas oligophenolica]